MLHLRLLQRAQHQPLGQPEQPGGDYPLILNTGRTVEHWHTRTKTGEVAILDGIPVVPILERVRGCKAGLAKYPNVKLVDTQNGKQERFWGQVEGRLIAMLEGEPEHRDSVLTEDERAANKTMMICCSGSKSPRLVLDI